MAAASASIDARSARRVNRDLAGRQGSLQGARDRGMDQGGPEASDDKRSKAKPEAVSSSSTRRVAGTCSDFLTCRHLVGSTS